ncbi:MAG: nitrous oxide reductase family maturation protein NosD [Planctomycetota bacterium]
MRPGERAPTLAAALEAARDGDTVLVVGGRHRGPLTITRRITLQGRDWPVIDGSGVGTVLEVRAAGTIVRGLEVTNTGSSLDEENSGIAVDGARGVVIEGNRLTGTLFGIYLRKAPDSVLRRNVIRGKPFPVPRRGDAIRVWYSDGVRIEENDVLQGRDVVLWYSNHLAVRDNVVELGRYGLHFMYCDDADIQGNRLSDNSVGAFLMYSRRLHLHRNLISGNRGPSGFGVGLKDMDDAVVEGNLFRDNRIGANVVNSPREVDSTARFENNVFAGNDVGVRLQPAVRHNRYVGNSFIDNQVQVGLTGQGRLQDNLWTVGGLGNYWSDYSGYDADGDGRGDVPYRADRLFENLLDREPKLRLFLYSPAAEAIDFAARAFPLVRPEPKLTDTAPLLAWTVPVGLPWGPPPDPTVFLASAAGLLLLGALLVLAPSLPLPGRRPTMPPLPAVPDQGPLLEVEGLTKRYAGQVALDGLTFTARRGEAIALWGSNGAGKTTALRCLLGLLPCEGRVRVAGQEVNLAAKAARARIGFVPQELNLHDDPTVLETTRFYARLKRAAPGVIPPLLERLGLSEHTHKAVRELSGGLKQRLALAVALLVDPPLLVLDEPTANLDARARAELLRLLGDLKAEGKTVVFSSHRLGEVVALADRVLVLERGGLAADLPPGELDVHQGLVTVLHLQLAGEDLERAEEVLVGEGFAPQRVAASLCVEVPARRAGRPIAALEQAGLELRGFELERSVRQEVRG